VAGREVLVPVDLVVGASDGVGVSVVSTDSIPSTAEGLWDIGPQSAQAIIDVCASAKTVIWNGPVGKFEDEAYATSTKVVAEGLATMDNYRVVGGGHTVNALEKYNVANKYDHVSVGGGAMVAYLEGKRMPGLEPLFS
jgi:phosphoglycerate kinase